MGLKVTIEIGAKKATVPWVPGVHARGAAGGEAVTGRQAHAQVPCNQLTFNECLRKEKEKKQPLGALNPMMGAKKSFEGMAA